MEPITDERLAEIKASLEDFNYLSPDSNAMIARIEAQDKRIAEMKTALKQSKFCLYIDSDALNSEEV